MGKGFKKAISAARRTVRANERSGGMCGPGNGAAQDELQSKGLNDFSSTLGTLDSMKSVAGIEAGSKFLGPAGAAVSAANTMVNYEPHATGEKTAAAEKATQVSADLAWSLGAGPAGAVDALTGGGTSGAFKQGTSLPFAAGDDIKNGKTTALNSWSESNGEGKSGLYMKHADDLGEAISDGDGWDIASEAFDLTLPGMTYHQGVAAYDTAVGTYDTASDYIFGEDGGIAAAAAAAAREVNGCN